MLSQGAQDSKAVESSVDSFAIEVQEEEQVGGGEESRNNQVVDDEAAKRSRSKMLRNVFLLSASWCFGIAAAFVQISTTTIVARKLNGEGTSTLPLGIILLLAGVSAVFVPRLLHKYGGRKVFLFGASLGVVGGLLSLIGLLTLDDLAAFVLLCLGAVPQGFTYACTNNFRLAAVQFSTPEFAPKAIAIVVGGGILGAFLGPELSKSSQTWLDTPYAGSYLQVTLLYVLLLVTLALIEFPDPKKKREMVVQASQEQEKEIPKTRNICELLRCTSLPREIVLQAISYSAMGALMAATPLQMQQVGLSFNQSTTAITAHMLGMFLPSFVSGSVVKRFGAIQVAFGGFLLLLLGSLLFLIDNSVGIFISAITIVGVGWNFSFVAATTLVTKVYANPVEMSRVHSLNDGIVIGVLGITLIGTGFVFKAVGWTDFVIIFSAYIGVAVLVSGLGTLQAMRQNKL